jgi:hypothetical protein
MLRAPWASGQTERAAQAALDWVRCWPCSPRSVAAFECSRWRRAGCNAKELQRKGGACLEVGAAKKDVTSSCTSDYYRLD